MIIKFKIILINCFFVETIQLKSYSLTGPGAAQLSQSVKDRFASGSNSLPKSSLDMHAFHARLAKKVFNPLLTSMTNKNISLYPPYFNKKYNNPF